MDEAKENDWLNIAKEAAKKAGEKILQIYGNEFSVSYKEDKSPLTIADQKSNDSSTNFYYRGQFPNYWRGI